MTNTTSTAVQTETGEHTYEIGRVGFGWHRWAFTRDGVVLEVRRYRRNVEQAIENAAGFAELLGYESASVTWLVRSVEESGVPVGLHTFEDADAWKAGAR